MIVVCIIGLIALGNVIRSIVDIAMMFQDKDLIHIYNTLIHLAGAYSLYRLVFDLKKEGYWAFGIINIVNGLVIGEIDHGEYAYHIMLSIIYSAVVYAVLLIPKDGVTAWQVIRKKEGES